jgi:hypothetical protein
LDAYRFSEKNYTRISVLYSIKNAPGVIFDWIIQLKLAANSLIWFK